MTLEHAKILRCATALRLNDKRRVSWLKIKIIVVLIDILVDNDEEAIPLCASQLQRPRFKEKV